MLSYRNILQSEYLKRQAKNSSYSLRSFARDLGLSQPFLSQIINGKRKLSDETGLVLAEKMNLKGTQKRLFIQLVRLERMSSNDSKKILSTEIEKLLKRQTNFKPLAEDVFNVVADWHYFAILELTTLENFKEDPQWIAKKLRLPLVEVKVALARLSRLGLLSQAEGKWVKTEKDYIFENIPSAAIRKHHRDTLQLAHKALTEQDLAQREFFTVVMPMDPAQIQRVKTKIREFSEELTAEMQETKPRSLYKLAIQFFRLDQETVS